jgi:hypothetical protein
MAATLESLDESLRAWAAAHGIRVLCRSLGPEKPGTFDGPSVTVSPDYDLESRCFFLAHSLGSIAVWTADADRSQAVFDELRDAKRAREADRARFERALDDWSAFEGAASESAVGLLGQVGHDWAVRSYTEFARADAEMMLAFHRHGRAPVWRDFFPAWRQRLARGEVDARPYKPRPVPDGFRPARMPKQEVFREEDGRPDE